MSEYSYGVQNPISLETTLNGRAVDITVHEITILDDRQFISGTIYDESTGDAKEFVSEVDPSARVAVDERGLMNNARQNLMQESVPDILESRVAAGPDALKISAGESFADVDEMRASMRDLPQAGVERVPDVAADAEIRVNEDVRQPLARESGAPIDLRDVDGLPPGIDDFEIDGQKGSLVVHEIEFADEKPFMTGTFTVDTPTGSETREFALAIDETRFPDPTSLSADDISKLSSPDVIEDMLDSRKHNFVLSIDEGFPNRAGLLNDINRLLPLNGGAFNGDIPLLSVLGQENPDFVESVARYGSRSENGIKLAILDHLEVTDEFTRQNLVYGTGSLEEFSDRPLVRSALFEAGGNTTKVVGEIVDKADDLADLAEQARDVSRVADGAKLARSASMFGGITVTALSVGGTAMASDAQRDMAFELANTPINPDDPNSAMYLSQDAYNAYVELNIQNNVAITGAELGTDWAGPIGFVATYFTSERYATEALQEWAAEHAPNLPDEVFQALKQGMWGGHTAQTEMFLETAGAIPNTKEGWPEALHDLIDARNDFFEMRADAVNARGEYGGRYIPPEQEAHFERMDELAEMAENRLIGQMEGFMSDPEQITMFLDILPIEDRLEYVRRLAASEENMEVFAANHPQIAEYVSNYNGDDFGLIEGSAALWAAKLVRNNIIGHDEIDTSLINDYIVDRSGVVPEKIPELDDIRTKIDALITQGAPEDAPPELVGLIELQGLPDKQEEFFQDIVEDGHIQIVSSFLDGVAVDAPQVEPAAEREYAAVDVTSTINESFGPSN